jgi:hypothetical protein
MESRPSQEKGYSQQSHLFDIHVELMSSSSGYGSFTDMRLSNDILINLSFWSSISLRFLI